MSKEFSVNLTGRDRLDLWSFFYQHAAIKPTSREALRNLDAVLDVLGVTEVQERFEAIADGKEGETVSVKAKDFDDKAFPVGSVDLKRAIEYLDKIPETIPVALSRRLLRISDLFDDAKGSKRRLEAVSE
jgi:hypothetical protein